MSGTTTNQGYPYPLTTDFADVQDAYRLAAAIDADIRAAQAPFRNFEGRPAFIVRSTSNGISFQSGSDPLKIGTVDYDNTGGAVVNNRSWSQPTSEAPSWWLFGGTVLSTAISGTPVVGDELLARIQVRTTDQVSGVVSTTNYYQRNDETNTNGEWINIFATAAIYRATVSLSLLLNGSTQKAMQSGSCFFGFYLGPVT